MYATAKINKDDPTIPYLMGSDLEGKFMGLTLSNTPNTEISTDALEVATLQILSKASGEWEVPVNSRVKFNQSSIANLTVDIDGGEIE